VAVHRSAKTGIGNRALKPTLGIIDPINMETMPKQVAIASGFDVLCHSLESFTAVPYNQRTPRPPNPNLRPAYQVGGKTVFLSHLYVKTMILPRQARDKRRESTQKKNVSSPGVKPNL
jgi:hydroxyacid-oxoacid transhydrogenase